MGWREDPEVVAECGLGAGCALGVVDGLDLPACFGDEGAPLGVGVGAEGVGAINLALLPACVDEHGADDLLGA